jgi:hypothetical protein
MTTTNDTIITSKQVQDIWHVAHAHDARQSKSSLACSISISCSMASETILDARINGGLRQDQGNTSLVILDINGLRIGHQKEVDDAFGRAISKGQMKGQHALVVFGLCSLGVRGQKSLNHRFGGLEDNGGMDGQLSKCLSVNET